METVTAAFNPNVPYLNNMDPKTECNGHLKRSQALSLPAVSVKNAHKTYPGEETAILNNFNMTVQQGTIYGLLGASGCGKTTILSCIVGIKKLERGDIFVFGQRPGTPECGIPGRQVGYMPQDIALYGQLTIKEILEYFGRIYGMSRSEIAGRIEFLTHFLDLPAPSQRVEDLSGGQKRRASLAACLLHEPSLLILDEPTVGVDPLLRESIWEHLGDMVAKKHVTVIITTHYIEEARQSHTVGLMRNGRLLTEKAPEALLEEHKTMLLETIVLKLCKHDVSAFEIKESSTAKLNNNNNSSDEIYQTLRETSFYSKKRKRLKNLIRNADESDTDKSVVGLKFKPTVIDEQRHNEINSSCSQNFKRRRSLSHQLVAGFQGKFSRIWAVAMRNFLILLRSPLFILAIFFMPSFQIIIVNLTLGPEPKNLDFGIVDPEVEFNLSNCRAEREGCSTEQLSCKFINTLPNNIINPLAVSSEREALQKVQNGELWGYMEFPTNYSEHLALRGATGIWSENDTLEGSTISLRLDMSQYFAGALVIKSVYESFQKFVMSTLASCDQNPRKAELPLKFNPPIYGSSEITFQDYISPGVLMMILYFIPYLSCSVANITDRKQGTLDRSMVAGVNMTDILAAFFLTEGILIVIQTLISYTIVSLVFQTDIKGSVIAYMLLTIITGFAGLSFGFLVAQLVDEEVEALIVGVGCYLPNLILTGIIWPLEAAPIYIRYLSYFLPCTLAISSIRSIVNRGWSITHRYVWPGYAVLLSWIVLTWMLALIVRRIRNK